MVLSFFYWVNEKLDIAFLSTAKHFTLMHKWLVKISVCQNWKKSFNVMDISQEFYWLKAHAYS